MPRMRETNMKEQTRVAVVAVMISDLHLTLSPPPCRKEEDWLAVQAEYLKQVKDFAGKLPILCAGDIFDKWNPPPELIRFAYRELPNNMVCIPGQHDLPNHLISLMHRSGYGVLQTTGKIRDISQGGKYEDPTGAFTAYGFGWNEPIVPPFKEQKGEFAVAVIHRYVWERGFGYPGAPETLTTQAQAKDLAGYKLAVYGDNHQGFTSKLSRTTIYNCGGFLRRKSDEQNYSPAIGILYADGEVRRVRLDTSKDEFVETVKEEEIAVDMKHFIEQLEGLGEHGLNFREAVERYMDQNEVPPRTKAEIVRALEESK